MNISSLGGGGFNPMAAMQGGQRPTQAQMEEMMKKMGGKPPNADDMKTKLTEQFGADKVKDIFSTDENGKTSINVEKLDSFMKAEGIERPPGAPDISALFGAGAGQKPGGIGKASTDQNDFLKLFESDFGEEESKKIKDKDGKVDPKKVHSYLTDKLEEKGYSVNSGYNAQGQGTQDLMKSLFNLTGDKSYQIYSQVV